MSNNFKINVIKITQPIWDFYIWKINANKLIDLSFSDIRRMEEDKDDKFIWVQRNLNKKRIKKIKEYLESYDSTFPNSVVLTIESENIVSEKDNILEIVDSKDVFSIIDWQHRLAWLDWHNKANDFDIIVTIFKDLTDSQQANLFSTINSEQSKVDPSLKYNLELESELYTPRKFVALLTETFNSFEKSPFYSKLKILWSNMSDEEKRDTILSWSWFSRELENILYKDEDYFKIRNLLHKNKDSNRKNLLSDLKYDSSKYILWTFYLNDDIKWAFKILFDYFITFKNNFDNDWNNSKSILLKTTWYWAMIKLFVDIYNDISIKKLDVNTESFNLYISKVKEMDWTINSENYKSSWWASANELYKIFKEKIFKEGN